MEVERTKLDELLVEKKVITTDQLKMAHEFQRSVGGKLTAVLVKLGFVTDENLAKFIGEQQGLEVIDLDSMWLPDNLVKKIPRDLIEKHHVFPIAFKDDILTLATSEPMDFEATEEIQLVTNYRIEMALATRSAIQRSINRSFYEAPKAEEPKKDQLIKELEDPGVGKELSEKAARQDVTPMMLRRALIPLLLAKGVFTEDELIKKAKELD